MVLRRGDLINTGTTAGIALARPGQPYLPAGDVVGLAIDGLGLALTFAMATDLVGDGICVKWVNPGTVHTPFVDRKLERFEGPITERAALDVRQVTGRMVTPLEVAGAIV